MSEGMRDEPWWASGAGPGDGLDDGDPVGRHTAGRRGAASPHPDGAVCQACPVCVALRALEGARPEMVAHLSEALHHLSLAARAFLEAQVGATGATGADGDLRRVDLDDE